MEGSASMSSWKVVAVVRMRRSATQAMDVSGPSVSRLLRHGYSR